MDIASQILIVGGTTLLTFGLFMGIPMVLVRNRSAQAPRYLFAAHLVPIIQGGLLLALTIALDYASLPPWLATMTAAFLVGGMALFVAGLALNWLQGIKDAFAENAVGGKVSALGLPFVLSGGVFLLAGVYFRVLA
ncbi:hypothetical protein [Natronospira bacteriovora]|uniref:DUF350 domain-containing protein n=1 Tax=Natronospira bacteriovora TaxID=3069753 RepID=A0ABU0W837_9GAMM|nr:hypothetical protein [Natronospira sp. AB-CW4]MDQ2069913.1 hypothetical protein [Natronospira sp. AB-CW4]